MGTTAFMAMARYRPDILDKWATQIPPGSLIFTSRVRLANFLAPVTSEANMGGPLGWIADYGNAIGVRYLECVHTGSNYPGHSGPAGGGRVPAQ